MFKTRFAARATTGPHLFILHQTGGDEDDAHGSVTPRASATGAALRP
tara:strand:+ start:7541 stop:7681 length:141 start_codon:yes stop_codon:yes gene_type:complete